MEEEKDWVLAELVVALWRCGCQWYISTGCQGCFHQPQSSSVHVKEQRRNRQRTGEAQKPVIREIQPNPANLSPNWGLASRDQLARSTYGLFPKKSEREGSFLA